jgi:superfamily II DNA/RNA helicase
MQHERTEVINRFRQGSDVLIATDIAARGLDVPEIRFVVNYEEPKDKETFIHRIGRTGRAGSKEGVAISLVLRSEHSFAALVSEAIE